MLDACLRLAADDATGHQQAKLECGDSILRGKTKVLLSRAVLPNGSLSRANRTARPKVHVGRDCIQECGHIQACVAHNSVTYTSTMSTCLSGPTFRSW